MSSVAVLADPRHRRSIMPYIVERPMPATPKDIDELRGLLRWAEGLRGPISHPHAAALKEGLKKALHFLEDPDRRINRALFILSAIRQSMHQREDGFWQVADRDLQGWALQQIDELDKPLPPTH